MAYLVAQWNASIVAVPEVKKRYVGGMQSNDTVIFIDDEASNLSNFIGNTAIENTHNYRIRFDVSTEARGDLFLSEIIRILKAYAPTSGFIYPTSVTKNVAGFSANQSEFYSSTVSFTMVQLQSAWDTA